MKRRAPDRGAGETSARAKALCPGMSGNNAKRAGPFILGPRLGNSPVQSIVQCLARKDGTDDFYQLKKNIVHRDLKLGNMVLNKRTHRIIITNFCLGKHLVSEDDLLKDQRGSPAYISPDVLSGKIGRPSPSDLWVLKITMYSLLYGNFPQYASLPNRPFRQIASAEQTTPQDGRVSENTVCLIRKLLVLDPQQRLTASEVLDSLNAVIASWQSVSSLGGPLQVVPDIDDQLNNPENSQEAKVTEESSQYEFENYMRQQLMLAEEKNTIHEAKSFIHKRHCGNIPPVRRLGHDAQPVNPLDAAILAQRFLRK
ncbi:serine/threonine-protein kinase 40 [Protopterus annectens]|uniref:serine/threonine-protein kinase 40 n=1 Tax=Protopterus annectens TaxID=7888 RepID=UPI001CFB8C8F|nr:serine/threonine-protein kinase 40 [Protopterus annectens]